MTPFTIVTNNIKCLGVNLTKQVNDWYDKNFKSMKKEFEDLRKWKDLPCTWIGRINVVKMAIMLKAIHRFNAITIKISTQFFIELEREILKFIWIINISGEETLLSTIKDHGGGSHHPWHQPVLQSNSDKNDMVLVQWQAGWLMEWIEGPEIKPYNFGKKLKPHSWKKTAF